MKTKLLILLSILLTFLSQAQQRGNFSFAAPAAMPLMNMSPMMNSGGGGGGGYSQITVSGVGGISYDQVASPDANLQISSMTLDYAGNNFDGERLKLTINGKKVNSTIFDWQLIPIAKFADSESHSCFTYFGKLQDKVFENLVLDNNGHILNYHPSFSNTLLGMRLMDMDLLILYNFTNDLPKVNNAYLLGGGEKVPDVNANAQGINGFISLIVNIENDLKQEFRSYILSDFNRFMTFNVQNDSLQLHQFPFYYCWRYKIDDPAFNETAERNAISQSYENIKAAEIKKNASFDVKMFVIDSLIAKADFYQKYFDLFDQGTFYDLVNLPNDRATRVNFLNRYSLNSLNQLLIDVSYYMEAYTPEYLKEFSIRMSDTGLLKKTNPAVWNANVNVMRYAAFFRYLKLNFPIQWTDFIRKLDGIVPPPQVKTPTIMYDSGNSVIENALLKVSVVSLSPEKTLNCYPNPFTETISLTNTEEIERFSIYGADGRLFIEKQNCPTNYRINTSSLKAGIYSLVVTQKDTQLKTFKIIKK